jgi:hypothetical protein
MSILDLATTAVNPYLLYIKLALIALAIAAVIGVVFYIKHTFSERDALMRDKAQLEFSLATEKQRVAVAMEQLKIWQDTVAKMNAAVKNIKIQSDTYIQGVEDAKTPDYADGTVIPFVLPASSARTSLPRFENVSAGRRRSATP